MLLRAPSMTVKTRHCERSEAIHRATKRKNGLLRRYAPRNDETRQTLDDGLDCHGPAPREGLLHRPGGFGDRGLRWEDGDELAADILQQYRIGVVVLAHFVELDALPRHDGLLARDVGGNQRFTDLVAVGGLGAIDRIRHHDQAHELPRREV